MRACAGDTEGLFASHQLEFESQYWGSMAPVLTCLDLQVEAEKMTEGLSAALCQLSVLNTLELRSYLDAAEDFEAVVNLDLPRLEILVIADFGPVWVKLSCPYLSKLLAQNVALCGFSGMPSSIQDVCLELSGPSVALREIFPAHSAPLLKVLAIMEDYEEFADPETVKELCLNGSLTSLTIDCEAGLETDFDGLLPLYGAFGLDALWQAVPQTLQDVSLELPLHEGIPKILEQLPILRTLSLRHNRKRLMHLDRPLDPFLDMPTLEFLELFSCLHGGVGDGSGMCLWTPAALKLLGLADQRIMQMRLAPPGRTITLRY